MIHLSADISPTAIVGANTTVWHRTQIGGGARVGDECIIGSNVYIDRGVVIGSRVKIQTGAQLYHGATVEDGVFIGPLVCLTNDKYPRAIAPDGRLKTDADWRAGTIRVRTGAALGAGAIVLTDVTIGRFALVGAGALVTTSVPDHGLVIGAPARLVGYACACGQPLHRPDFGEEGWVCPACGGRYVCAADHGLTIAARQSIHKDHGLDPREQR